MSSEVSGWMCPCLLFSCVIHVNSSHPSASSPVPGALTSLKYFTQSADQMVWNHSVTYILFHLVCKSTEGVSYTSFETHSPISTGRSTTRGLIDTCWLTGTLINVGPYGKHAFQRRLKTFIQIVYNISLTHIFSKCDNVETELFPVKY